MSCAPALLKGLGRTSAVASSCACASALLTTQSGLLPPPPRRSCKLPKTCQLSTLRSCDAALPSSADFFCMASNPCICPTKAPAVQPPALAERATDMTQCIKQKMVSLCKRSAHTVAAPSLGPLAGLSCGGSKHTTAAAASTGDTDAKPADTAANTRESSPGVTAPSSPKLTFYRRELPEDLVSFTSADGRKLFKESLNEGYAEGYFNLAGNFTVQSEPAYCGPSSLAMVLNALEVDPGRTWKGIWRWYSDELLESCRTESDLKANGITYDQFLCLASSHAHVITKRGATASREEFLRDIKYVTQRDDVFMVLSFARAVLGQTGDGHFSPIGAYHPGSNRALVLDSARYKYPSWFCDVDKLYDSLQPVDPETNLPRGYFLISRRDSRLDPGLLASPQLKSDAMGPGNVVDLPERPVDVFPTKLSCGKKPSCCSGK